VPEEVALFDERLQYEGDVFDVPEFWLDGVWRNVACSEKIGEFKGDRHRMLLPSTVCITA
jgi:hypothetical protein